MKNLITLSLIILAFVFNCICAQPTEWISKGIGGGGAMFSPSINPSNDNEFYVASDMSGLFHTTDFGASYNLINFKEFQGGSYSIVRFTNNPQILYSIRYFNDFAEATKSTDGGITWFALSGMFSSLAETYNLFVDYNNPNRVLVASWLEIAYSIDGGSNFTQIHVAEDEFAGLVTAGAFFDGNNIYIGTNDGLLISNNGGTSFSKLTTTGIPADERIFSFAGAKQGNTTRFFCITGDMNMVYAGLSGSDYYDLTAGIYSMDLGTNRWQSKTSGITIGEDFLVYVAMAENDINTVYLAGSYLFGTPNIMKSTNAGNSWVYTFITGLNENIATGWCGDNGDQDWWYAECPLGFAVAPKNSQKLIFTDFGFVHKSSDGGTSWHQAYLKQSDENPLGNPTPSGKYYHGIGLENTSCWQVSWFDENNIFAAFSDIRGLRSTDGGDSWSFDFNGQDQNTMYRIEKNPSSGIMYAATSSVHDIYQSTFLQDRLLDNENAVGKIIYSTNGGIDWQDLHDFRLPVFWLALDPNNNNKMYASVINYSDGKGGVYVCNNLNQGASANWTQLPDPPRTEGHPASIVVLNDGSVLCTYSGRRDSTGHFTPSSGVFLYDVQTQNWSDLSHSNMYYWTKDITVDPGDASQSTWYVGVFSGWGGPPNELGGLYKTTDRGASWNRILVLDRVTSCTINPNNHDEMFVTTEQDGLWYCKNINTSNPQFVQVETYPFRQPERVFFNPYKQEVWITSFGNGIRVGKLGTDVEWKTVSKEKFDFMISPIPCSELITISSNLSVSGIIYISIYDLTGRKVIDKNSQIGEGYFSEKLNINRLNSGVYYIRLSIGTQTAIKQLQVIK